MAELHLAERDIEAARVAIERSVALEGLRGFPADV